MSKYLKILHHYSYVPQIQRDRLSGKHSSKTSPIKPHYETLDMNQQFGPVHQEGGWGNFHPAKLIPEIVRIFNLPETTILIGRKPQKPHLTSSIKHPSIANLHFLTCEYNFWGGGVQ